jgi:hypothetical protein
MYTCVLAHAQIALAFQQQNRSLPPWRTPEALLSKWAPSQMEELAKLMRHVSMCVCACVFEFVCVCACARAYGFCACAYLCVCACVCVYVGVKHSV